MDVTRTQKRSPSSSCVWIVAVILCSLLTIHAANAQDTTSTDATASDTTSSTIARKTSGENCTTNEECSETLTCSNSTSLSCDCGSDQFFNIEDRECQNKPCKNSTQCVNESVCDKKGSTCQCEEDRYEQDNRTCVLKIGFGGDCSDTGQCKNNLVCNDTTAGMCGCDISNFPNITTDTCQAKSGINETCSDQTQCNSTLTCDPTGSKCVCTTEQWYDTSSSQCKPKSGINGTCTDQTQCNSTLTCDLTGNKCVCTTDQWYDTSSSQCKQKSGINGTCTDQTQCKNTLTCTGNKCVCATDQWYETSSSQCKPKSGYNGACTVQAGCMPSLTCDGTKCTCTSDQYYDNISQCKTKISYGGTCSGVQGIQGECKEPSLVCVSYIGTVKRCLCDSNSYRTDNGVCQSNTNLTVTFQDPWRQTTEIELKWTDNSQRGNVAYSITWTPTTTNQATATTTGANVVGLVPGTLYTFTVVGTLSQDQYYQVINSTIQTTAWTHPAKPGLVTGATLLPNQNTQITDYEITFVKSNGNVANYSMTVVQETITSSDSKMVFKKLSPGNIYPYSLTSSNGYGDISEPSTGTFSTNSTEPGPVKDLIAKPSNFSANISWRTPENKNGKIIGYQVQINHENGSCLYIMKVPCSDCSQQNQPTATAQPPCPTSNGSSYTSTELNETNKKFDLELQDLQPYRIYGVEMFAINDAGNGIKIYTLFTTEEAVANSVTDFSIYSVRNDSSNMVKLIISWIPGVITGNTTYYVNITEAKGQDPNEAATYNNTNPGSVNNKTTYEADNVLASWDYTVQIMAGTKVGNSSWSIPKTNQTVLSYPGSVTNFTVDQDQNIAKTLKISFTCPDEKIRNGTISKYEIRQISLDSNQTLSWDFQPMQESCSRAPSTYTFNRNDIVVQDNYTFEIRTSNANYKGEYGTPVTLATQARVPMLANTAGIYNVDALIIKSSNTKYDAKTTITVSVCTACLTDKSQGIIRDAGIIVCPGENKCSLMGRKKRSPTQNEYLQLANYDKAKNQDFKIRYRTTPDNWINTLEGKLIQTSYVIGGDANCGSSSGLSYCNGPLASGRNYYISVIACTDAGCNILDSNEVFATQKGDETNVGAIVGGVLGGLALLLVICVIIFLILRFQKRDGRPTRTSNNFTDADRISKELVVKQKRPIKMRDFSAQLIKLHKDSNLLFQGEFEDIKNLSMTFKTTCNEAQRESNRVKNRYVDILPFDHSRVKLDIPPEGDETMDFINANYIPGYTSVREYIATQGPMHCTIPDFWQMAWEQKCKVIVMLSDLTEHGKRKVDLYWPENLNEPINYGSVIVEMTNFSQLNKYVIRNFKVSKGSESRRMTHLFLIGWEDFSANLSADIVLEFTKQVRQEATPVDSGPVIVHCSAGVGRTGTLIALDYFTQYIDKHSLDDEIDIFDYVIKMRKNRPRMVQAESQYIFIFDTLKEVIQKKIKAEEEKLYENLKDTNGIYANVGQQEENIYANSNVSNNTNEDKYVYNNEAFEPDATNNQNPEKPITEL